ncbi:MAG: class I SAM-dependent methyltransferase [Chloroflexota bacterium]
MKNRDKWQPSKYVYRRGRLVASRDRKEIGVGSRLTADLTAGFYDRALRLHAKGKLLDLGCGKVPLYIAYRDYVTDNICVDWENTLHKSEHLDCQCDLTRDLPFGDEEFDTIVLSDVLEHVPEPEHLWKEMARILAGGGKILANVPFYYWLHEQPHDYYRFTEFALRRFVESSGLRLIQLESSGGTPEIVADIYAKHVKFIPLVGRGLAAAIQCATGAFVKTALGRRISRRTSRAFPLGYFLVAEKAE